LPGVAGWNKKFIERIWIPCNSQLGGGFNPNIFGIFTPKLGEDDSQFDEHVFQLGLVQPPTN